MSRVGPLRSGIVVRARAEEAVLRRDGLADGLGMNDVVVASSPLPLAQSLWTIQAQLLQPRAFDGSPSAFIRT